MNRVALLSIFLFFLVELSTAQNTVQLSLPYFNQFGLNPARAGLEDQLDVSMVVRHQWAGINQSPSVQNLSASIPFDLLHGGIGVNVYNQNAGALRWTTAKLGYAYNLSIDEYSVLGIGGTIGIVNSSLDGSQLRTPTGTYNGGVFSHNDANLPLGKVSSSSWVGDFGVFYLSDRIEAGVSLIGGLGGELNFDDGFLSRLNQFRTLDVFLAYNLDFLQGITLIPHVYVKSDFNITQTELHLLTNYNNLIVGGGLRGYNERSLDAFIATFGVELKGGLTLLYAYDSTLSTLNTISTGSHEFVIRYSIDTRLGKGKPPGIIYNPRNL